MNVGMVLSICVVYLLDFLWNIVHGKWTEFTNTEWLVFLKICYVIFFIMPDDSKDAKQLISCKVLYKMKHIHHIILICQALETFAIPLISWKSCMIYIEQNLRQIILLCKALEIYPFSVAHISVQVSCSLNLASIHHKDNSVISGDGKTIHAKSGRLRRYISAIFFGFSAIFFGFSAKF